VAVQEGVMAAPKRVVMPREPGRPPIPNPIRWSCDQGHIHPSRQHAIVCNRRHRDKKEPAR
jgi:hypothetical protein